MGILVVPTAERGGPFRIFAHGPTPTLLRHCYILSLLDRLSLHHFSYLF